MSLGSAAFTLFLAFLANAVWAVAGPTLIEVLSALVQTGVTTRLVLLGLFFVASLGVVAFRRLSQVWYGRAACAVALAVAWNIIARLAVQIQAVDALALVGAACVLVHGLVIIQQADDQPSA